MSPQNLQIALRSFTQRRPFQRYIVEFNNGHHIRVHHPEALHLRGTLAVFVTPQNHYILFDSDSVTRVCDEDAV
jgi:hypothetical protein